MPDDDSTYPINSIFSNDYNPDTYDPNATFRTRYRESRRRGTDARPLNPDGKKRLREHKSLAKARQKIQRDANKEAQSDLKSHKNEMDKLSRDLVRNQKKRNREDEDEQKRHTKAKLNIDNEYNDKQRKSHESSEKEQRRYNKEMEGLQDDLSRSFENNFLLGDKNVRKAVEDSHKISEKLMKESREKLMDNIKDASKNTQKLYVDLSKLRDKYEKSDSKLDKFRTKRKIKKLQEELNNEEKNLDKLYEYSEDKLNDLDRNVLKKIVDNQKDRNKELNESIEDAIGNFDKLKAAISDDEDGVVAKITEAVNKLSTIDLLGALNLNNLAQELSDSNASTYDTYRKLYTENGMDVKNSDEWYRNLLRLNIGSLGNAIDTKDFPEMMEQLASYGVTEEETQKTYSETALKAVAAFGASIDDFGNLITLDKDRGLNNDLLSTTVNSIAGLLHSDTITQASASDLIEQTSDLARVASNMTDMNGQSISDTALITLTNVLSSGIATTNNAISSESGNFGEAFKDVVESVMSSYDYDTEQLNALAMIFGDGNALQNIRAGLMSADPNQQKNAMIDIVKAMVSESYVNEQSAIGQSYSDAGLTLTALDEESKAAIRGLINREGGIDALTSDFEQSLQIMGGANDNTLQEVINNLPQTLTEEIGNWFTSWWGQSDMGSFFRGLFDTVGIQLTDIASAIIVGKELFGKDGLFSGIGSKIFGKDGLLRGAGSKLFGEGGVIRTLGGKLLGKSEEKGGILSKGVNFLKNIFGKGGGEAATLVGDEGLYAAGASIDDYANLWGSPIAETAGSAGGGGLLSKIAGGAKSFGGKALKFLGKAAPWLAVAEAGFDAFQGVQKAEEWTGDAGLQGQVSSGIGAFLGGTGNGLKEGDFLENAMEIGGGALKGAGVGAAIGSVVPVVGNVVGAAVGAVVGGVGSAIGGDTLSQWINGGIQGIKDMVTGAGTWIADTANAAGSWISETANTVGNWASETASSVGSWVSETAGSVGNWFSETAGNVGNWFGETAGTIGNWATSAATTAGEWIQNGATGIKNVFVNLAYDLSQTPVGQAVGEFANNIKNGAIDIGNKIGEFANGIWNGAQDVWGKITEFGGNLWQGAQDIAGKAWQGAQDIAGKIGEFGNSVWQGAQDIAGKAWQGAQDIANQAWQGAQSLWNTLVNSPVGQGIQQFASFISQGAQNVWNGITTFAGDVWNGAQTVWNNISSFAGNIWNGAQTVWNNITTFAGNIWQGAQDVWNNISTLAGNLWQGATDIANAIGEWASGIWNSVSSWFSDTASTVGNWVSNTASSVGNWVSETATNVSTTVGNWWDGVTSAVGDAASAAGEYLVGLTQDPEVRNNPAGSHAEGLSEVPYDNYAAILHKGEAVLTADQASSLKSDGGIDVDEALINKMTGALPTENFVPNPANVMETTEPVERVQISSPIEEPASNFNPYYDPNSGILNTAEQNKPVEEIAETTPAITNETENISNDLKSAIYGNANVNGNTSLYDTTKGMSENQDDYQTQMLSKVNSILDNTSKILSAISNLNLNSGSSSGAAYTAPTTNQTPTADNKDDEAKKAAEEATKKYNENYHKYGTSKPSVARDANYWFHVYGTNNNPHSEPGSVTKRSESTKNALKNSNPSSTGGITPGTGGNTASGSPGKAMPAAAPLAVGTPFVPNDQLAYIHKGEMVVPADQNPLAGSTTTIPINNNDDVVAVIQWLGNSINMKLNEVEQVIKESAPRNSYPRYTGPSMTDIAFSM